jgi:predicted lipoprotein
MKKILPIAIAGFLLLYACSKNDNGGGTNNNTTDEFKSDMLINYADNLIKPAFTNFNSSLTELETTITQFLNSPSSTTQQTAKSAFTKSYLQFESVSAIYFGPAAALLFNNYLNNFPCAPAKIEAAILSGTYNFNQPIVSDSIQGLPTLDYLLFSEEAISKFTAPNAAKRKQYVQDLITRIKQLSQNVLAQWNGNYRNVFVTSLKTDVGSSIGSLVNQFAFEMDAMKGPRIGWPFGKQSNNVVFADKCEGYYAGISSELAIANLSALKNYFVGGSGKGIDDYLILLKKEQLNTSVTSQFDVAIAALKAIPTPLSEAFTKNADKVETAYKEIQKLLTLIKTDVASATGVQITYMDNDGD